MSNNKVFTEQINVIFQCSKIFKTKDCNLPPFCEVTYTHFMFKIKLQNTILRFRAI